MNRKIPGILPAVLVLVAAGCGGANVTAADLEHDVPAQIEEAGGGTFTGVTCVKQTETTFRCIGDFRASHKATAESVAGIDTTGWTAADWEAMGEGRAVQVVLDVTVDQDTGRWVFTVAP